MTISSKRARIQLSAKSLSTIVALACSHLGLTAEPQQTSGGQVATQPAGQAAIAVDAAEFDFGSVRAGEKVEHRFKVTNTGTAELKITNVKTNCGCTVAGDYPKSLAPGASGEIPLALNTANMNGPFNKPATLFSNDPARPQLALVLKGEARPLIAVQPAGVYFGSIYGEKEHTQTYAAKGVKFLNVSETTGRKPFTRGAVVAKLAEFGAKAQATIDDNNTTGRQFSVTSFPTMFVLDKSGKIEAVNIGNLADLEAKLTSQLDRLTTTKR